jgi:hypothetical protein
LRSGAGVAGDKKAVCDGKNLSVAAGGLAADAAVEAGGAGVCGSAAAVAQAHRKTTFQRELLYFDRMNKYLI